jgi:hypothetical protein
LDDEETLVEEKEDMFPVFLEFESIEHHRHVNSQLLCSVIHALIGFKSIILTVEEN